MRPPQAKTAFHSCGRGLKDNMTSKRFLPLLATVTVFVLSVIAAEKPPGSGVILLDHLKVTEAFARSGPLLATNNFKILALRRNEPGEVEVHDRDTDIFYVLEGSAKFVTGGDVIEPRKTDLGETRAKSIAGGEERSLTKGDVVVVPNGVPHWFKEVSGPFLYFMVKVSSNHQ